MKTLDVHALHEGIQHTIEKLDKQKQQLEKLEKSVEHLAGMKDALKGKGGDAIGPFTRSATSLFSFSLAYLSTNTKKC